MIKEVIDTPSYASDLPDEQYLDIDYQDFLTSLRFPRKMSIFYLSNSQYEKR